MEVSSLTEERLYQIISEQVEKILEDKAKNAPEDYFERFSQSTAGRVIRIEERMVTKDDIKNMVTKDDIKNMATKDDIKNMATKDEIKNVQTWMMYGLGILAVYLSVIIFVFAQISR